MVDIFRRVFHIQLQPFSCCSNKIKEIGGSVNELFSAYIPCNSIQHRFKEIIIHHLASLIKGEELAKSEVPSPFMVLGEINRASFFDEVDQPIENSFNAKEILIHFIPIRILAESWRSSGRVARMQFILKD